MRVESLMRERRALATILFLIAHLGYVMVRGLARRLPSLSSLVMVVCIP
jgi:hypothetical protein